MTPSVPAEQLQSDQNGVRLRKSLWFGLNLVQVAMPSRRALPPGQSPPLPHVRMDTQHLLHTLFGEGRRRTHMIDLKLILVDEGPSRYLH